jgi:hypothetical protein
MLPDFYPRDEDSPHVSIYPCTEGVLDWAAHTLTPIDKSTFEYHQRLYSIYQKGRMEEEGKISRAALHAALRDFNAEHRMDVRIEDLGQYPLDLRVFVDAGDWVLWTDKPERILESDLGNIELAAYGAPEDVRWAALYLPSTMTLTVYRSSRLDRRMPLSPEAYKELTSLPACSGRIRGERDAFVLPPGIEGLITQERGRV